MANRQDEISLSLNPGMKEVPESLKQSLILLLKTSSGTIPMRGTKTLVPIIASLMQSNISEDARMAMVIINAVEDFCSIIFNSPSFYIPTLVGEANSAGEVENIGDIAKAGWVVSVIFSGPQIAIMVCAKPILTLFKQSDEVIRISEEYFSVYLWSVLPLSLQCVTEQVAQGAGHIYQPVIVQIVGLLATVGVGAVLGFGLFGAPNLGYMGPAWALLARSLVNFIFLHGYLSISSITNGVFSPYRLFNRSRDFKKLLQSFGKQMGIGTVMLVMFACEYTSLFFINMMAGLYGQDALSSQLVISNYEFFCMIPATGIGAAAQIVISNALKKNQRQYIFRYGNLATMLSVVLPFCYFLMGLFLPKLLIYPFFNPNEVNNQASVQILTENRLMLISGGNTLLNSASMVVGQSLMGGDKMLVALVVGILGNALSTLLTYFLSSTINDLNLFRLTGLALGFLAMGIYWVHAGRQLSTVQPLQESDSTREGALSDRVDEDKRALVSVVADVENEKKNLLSEGKKYTLYGKSGTAEEEIEERSNTLESKPS